MADKKKTKQSAGADPDAPKKSGKVKIIAGVVCVALAGAAYMLGSKSATPAASGPVTTTTIALIDGCVKEPEPGIPDHIVDMPEMSINLADGHYLRIAVSLGLCADVVLAEGEAFATAPAADIIVADVSGLKMDDLATEAGRNGAKETLKQQISDAYRGVVYEVYFVEFVMQ